MLKWCHGQIKFVDTIVIIMYTAVCRMGIYKMDTETLNMLIVYTGDKGIEFHKTFILN